MRVPVWSPRAEDGAQTRDPQLGRLVLYQLSYFRVVRSSVCELSYRKQL